MFSHQILVERVGWTSGQIDGGGLRPLCVQLVWCLSWWVGLVEWWCCVGVFKIDVGFVVECLIGGILLWGGGTSNTNRAIDGFILFVVWIPYL